jgi:hypothetical protein
MNEELRILFDEDIADARTFHGEEAFLASQARRRRVEQILDAGGVQTADDYLHATFIFQHGERLEHWAQAHLLAHTAADMGHPRARYMVAASYDRWLMRQGRPQKYGTNSINDGGRTRVWDYDPATSDAERAEWDVPPLAELLARAERINTEAPDPAHPHPLVTVEVQGLRVEIFDLSDPGPAADLPSYAVPPYVPLQPDTDPCPAYLPADAALWRFGRLYCAKRHDGLLLCTWHLCAWRLADAVAGVTAESLLAAMGHTPQWLSGETAFWSRLALPTGPDRCWIVGGWLPREELAQIAASLR